MNPGAPIPRRSAPGPWARRARTRVSFPGDCPGWAPERSTNRRQDLQHPRFLLRVGLLQALENRGRGDRTPTAHRNEGVLGVAALEFVQGAGDEAGAGLADRVADRDRSAVGVDLVEFGLVDRGPRQ